MALPVCTASPRAATTTGALIRDAARDGSGHVTSPGVNSRRIPASFGGRVSPRMWMA